MVLSWILFGALYVRLYQRYQRYKHLKRRHDRALLQAKHQQYRTDNNNQHPSRRQQQRPSVSSFNHSNPFRPPSHRSINDYKEQRDRAYFSLQLIVLCTITWTFIAVAFSVECFLPNLVSSTSIWASPDLPLITGHVLESLSKVWYLSLQLNVYDKIFDESNRAVRRLEELRTLMSALWESSSDIMVICARTDNIIHAVVSPSALLQSPPTNDDDDDSDDESEDDNNDDDDDDSAFSLSLSLHGGLHQAVLESSLSIMLEIVPATGTFCSFPVDLSKPVTRVDASTIQQARESSCKQFGSITGYPHMLQGTAAEKNLTTIAHLAYQVCESKLSSDEYLSQEAELAMTENEFSAGANLTIGTNNTSGSTEQESWMLQDLFSTFPAYSSQSHRIKCEAKVTPIDAGALLLVLRDVSERYERFEVEKKLLKEVIVRKKDAEAIRFTRHEVKNGLVAAIGIVDSFKEAYEKQRLELEELRKWKEQQQLVAAQENEKAVNSVQDVSGDDLDSYVTDLDSTLRQVLDTILDNAMTREILFEGYVPRRESVNLPELLESSLMTRTSNDNSSMQEDRFPIVTKPELFPHLTIDPQLLRNIYQHAVSNACKYGKVDGHVKTVLNYDSASATFSMEIFNLPGYNHERLVALSAEDVECVFTEGTQLRINQCLDTVQGKLASARSAGDGAYVMRKGAECLGGKCEIRFEEHGSTFSFACPATVCEQWLQNQRAADVNNEDDSAEKGPFSLPETTWAVVVEDSVMQHKLLDRFLKKAGIANDRLIALGKTPQEILQFTEKIREALKDHPDDNFLMIIDENLDVVEGGAVTKTVSGSFSIQELLKSLSPEDESRVLALIRSANDSVQEVELYQSRAHGFLLKGPIKKGGLLDEIKPWWIRRFMSKPPARSGEGKGLRRKSSSLSSSSEDGLGLARERITDLSREIDTLCNVDDSSVSSDENDDVISIPQNSDNDSENGSNDGLPPPPPRMSAIAGGFMDWPSIRYKLMLLNVDLKTHLDRDNFALAANSIDEITNSSTSCFLPQDLQHRWSDIRELIFRELQSSHKTSK